MRNLVDEYVKLAAEWGKLMVRLDPAESASANAVHDQIQRLYREISHVGIEEQLFKYADDPNDAVAFFVISHIRDRHRPEALRIYRRLSTSNIPSIALSAGYIAGELEKQRGA